MYPDRLIVLPGNKIGFAELKKKGKEPRKLQEAQMKFLKSLDCFVMTIDSEEDIEIFIKLLQEKR